MLIKTAMVNCSEHGVGEEQMIRSSANDCASRCSGNTINALPLVLWDSGSLRRQTSQDSSRTKQ
jgi:hypothetical protein